MRPLLYSNSAVEDLTQIWNYTFDNWSEERADQYYLEIISTCTILCQQPKISLIYFDFDIKIRGLKFKQYIIFYRIQTPNEIEIVRILHSSMDIATAIAD
jgi:toxin ParE1/3/4